MTGSGLQRHGEAWALAARQHGVVTRAQLIGLGFTRHAIAHRLREGRLHPVHRRAYAVGRPELSPYGRWLAALARGEERF